MPRKKQKAKNKKDFRRISLSRLKDIINKNKDDKTVYKELCENAIRINNNRILEIVNNILDDFNIEFEEMNKLYNDAQEKIFSGKHSYEICNWLAKSDENDLEGNIFEGVEIYKNLSIETNRILHDVLKIVESAKVNEDDYRVGYAEYFKKSAPAVELYSRAVLPSIVNRTRYMLMEVYFYMKECITECVSNFTNGILEYVKVSYEQEIHTTEEKICGNEGNIDKSFKDRSWREISKVAIENGYILERQSGDHGIFINSIGNVVVIPQGRSIGKGLQIRILKSIDYIDI